MRGQKLTPGGKDTDWYRVKRGISKIRLRRQPPIEIESSMKGVFCICWVMQLETGLNTPSLINIENVFGWYTLQYTSLTKSWYLYLILSGEFEQSCLDLILKGKGVICVQVSPPSLITLLLYFIASPSSPYIL